MKRERDRRSITTGTLAALCFAMSLVSLLSSFGATLAKYIATDNSAGAAVAAPFYFSSNKLFAEGEETKYWQVSEPGAEGSVAISFTVSNFIDDLRKTDRDIRYTCWAVTGDGIDGEEIPDTRQSGTLTSAQPTLPVSMTVPRGYFGSDGTVTVIAKSNTPYEKTLTARFTFTPQARELHYDVSTDNGAVIVEIYGGDGSPVTVTWDSDTLIPDPTSAILSAANNKSVTFTAADGVRYALVFFTENRFEAYNENNFTVTKSSSGG